MQYYTSDSPLRLREFGRNIQSMVEYAQSIEDREQRTQVAEQIIQIMINLQPGLTENTDYKQKLWDALHIISDFDLDVESPYEPPTPESVMPHSSERLEYYRERPRYKQYGKNVELMIEKAKTFEEGPERQAYINHIASTMKQFLRNANRDNTPDEVIAEHIRELSGNAIKVKASDITFHKITTQGGSQPSNESGFSSSRRRKGNKSKGNKGNHQNHSQNQGNSSNKSKSRKRRRSKNK